MIIQTLAFSPNNIRLTVAELRQRYANLAEHQEWASEPTPHADRERAIITGVLEVIYAQHGTLMFDDLSDVESELIRVG